MTAEGGSRGWGAVLLLALVVSLLSSVVHPALLIFVPLSLLLLALPPRHPRLVALGAVLVVLACLRPSDDSFWYTERGWALVLGAWYVIMVVAAPAAAFLSRALAALAAAVATALALSVANRDGWAQLDWVVVQRIQSDAAEASTLWSGFAGGGAVQAQLAATASRVAELQAWLYPALLGLASLAALGVAWWAFRRLGGQERSPLAPLREFRFRDELVWVLIAGVLLVLLPLGEVAVRAGSNVLVFMGALYALRGAAVILALAGGALGVLGTVFAAAAVILLYPLVMAATLLVGVTDTWLDLRSRRRSAARPDS